MHFQYQIIFSHSSLTQPDPPAKRRRRMDTETDFNSWLARNTYTNDEAQPLATEDPLYRARKEVERYLAMPAPRGNVDVLQFWRTNKSSYPLLFQVARKFLPVKATSCASERGWSTAGHFSGGKRHALRGDNLEALIFLNRHSFSSHH